MKQMHFLKPAYILFTCLEACIIVLLIYSIVKVAHHGDVLGKQVTLMRRDDYVFTVIDNNRLFWEHNQAGSETVSPDWLDYKVTYTINNDGLNSVHDYAVSKSTNVFRIVALGDSFTFGAWVNTPENYPSRLEILLNDLPEKSKNYEVLNLGESAYDVDYMIRRYRMRGKKYHPDVIVMLILECDFTELAGLMGAQVRKQEFQLRRGDDGMSALDRGMLAITNAHEDINTMTNNRIEQYQLETLRGFLDEADVPILIVTDDMSTIHGQSALSAIAKMHHNVYYDVLPEISRLADLHPSAEGHRQIARFIYDDLLRFDLVDRHGL